MCKTTVVAPPLHCGVPLLIIPANVLSGTHGYIKQQQQQDNEEQEGPERDEKVGGEKKRKYTAGETEEAESQRAKEWWECLAHTPSIQSHDACCCG